MLLVKRNDHGSEDGTVLSHGLALVAAVYAGLAATLAILSYLHAHIGHDQAWELYASAEVLRGVPMNGPDLVEVNPPFLLWFMSLPVLLARLLHIGPIAGFQVFFLGMVLPAILWTASLFRRYAKPSPLIFWVFLLLISWSGGIMIFAPNLGQREHIVVFLLLPYLVLAAMRMERTPVSAAECAGIGLIAAVAICLKPQHLLDVAAVEFVVLWRVRSLRLWIHPVSSAFGMGLIAYFVAVRLLQPAYFTNVVPLLRETYWGFNNPWRELIFEERRFIRGLVASAIVLSVLRSRLRMAALETVLLGAGTGALAAYFQQHKGWSYQTICCDLLIVLLVGLILVDLADRSIMVFSSSSITKLRSFYPATAVLLGVFLGVLERRIHPEPETYWEKDKTYLSSIFGEYPAGTNVFFLSVYPWQFPTVLEQKKVWASRYFHLWMLPAVLRSGNPNDDDQKDHLSPAETRRLSLLLRSTEAADLARWKPAVIVTQACIPIPVCDGLRQQHLASVLDWFLIDPHFSAEWGHYKHQRTIDDLNVYVRTQ